MLLFALGVLNGTAMGLAYYAGTRYPEGFGWAILGFAAAGISFGLMEAISFGYVGKRR